MTREVNPEQLSAWHRHFAMECNNAAWGLAEGEAQSADPQALLNLAHASAWHWQQIGIPLQKMRATMLLAQVHALMGLAPTALRYAQEMRDWFLTQEDTPDWEIAFVHAIHAHACAVAGLRDEHARSYSAALAALEAIADVQDREIVEVTFRSVPEPTQR